MTDFRIKEMECDGKKVPEKYIACFNDYIEEIVHEVQTQKAIECLKEVKKFVDGRTYLAEWIDNKIKELEEEK